MTPTKHLTSSDGTELDVKAAEFANMSKYPKWEDIPESIIEKGYDTGMWFFGNMGGDDLIELHFSGKTYYLQMGGYPDRTSNQGFCFYTAHEDSNYSVQKRDIRYSGVYLDDVDNQTDSRDVVFAVIDLNKSLDNPNKIGFGFYNSSTYAKSISGRIAYYRYCFSIDNTHAFLDAHDAYRTSDAAVPTNYSDLLKNTNYLLIYPNSEAIFNMDTKKYTTYPLRGSYSGSVPITIKSSASTAHADIIIPDKVLRVVGNTSDALSRYHITGSLCDTTTTYKNMISNKSILGFGPIATINSQGIGCVAFINVIDSHPDASCIINYTISW